MQIYIISQAGMDISDILMGNCWTEADIHTLPCDIAIVVRQFLHSCEHSPPQKWNPSGYHLIGKLAFFLYST